MQPEPRNKNLPKKIVKHSQKNIYILFQSLMVFLSEMYFLESINPVYNLSLCRRARCRIEGWCATRAKKQESANWVVCNQSRTRICQENGEKFRPNCRANCQLHALPLNPPRKMRLTLGCCHPTDIHHSIDHLLPKLHQNLKKCSSTRVKTYILWEVDHINCLEQPGNIVGMLNTPSLLTLPILLQT